MDNRTVTIKALRTALQSATERVNTEVCAKTALEAELVHLNEELCDIENELTDTEILLQKHIDINTQLGASLIEIATKALNAVQCDTPKLKDVEIG
jgi:hypothetical protein